MQDSDRRKQYKLKNYTIDSMVNMAAVQMENAAAMANSTTKTRFKAFKRTKSTLPRNMEYYVNKRRMLKRSCAAEA